jgi:hypothetical protein
LGGGFDRKSTATFRWLWWVLFRSALLLERLEFFSHTSFQKRKLFTKLVVVTVATRVVVVEAFHDQWSGKVKVLLETELII